MAAKSIPRPIEHWLNANPTIKELVSSCQQQQALLALVRSRLPDPLCDHCSSASLNGSQLVLAVDSPAWSGRLRLLQGRLRQELGQLDIDIRQVKVVVQPQSEKPKKTQLSRPVSLSADNALLIKSVAEGIDDPLLKQALDRLAKHSD